MQVNLSGKVALVTGAARGIGKAIADAMAENGAQVFYTDVDRREADKSASVWPSAKAAEMDVTNEAQVQAVSDGIVRECGRIDILVNNAGATIVAPSMDLATEDWQRVVDLNQTAVFAMTRRVAREMIARGKGAILNIASLTTFVAFPERLAYASTKAAIGAMTRVWAVEWAKSGVRVNAIAPGMVATALQERLAREGKFDVPAVEARIPMGYRATPDDLVGAAIFLVSDEASYITGVVLPVDGGFLANGFWHPTP